MRPPQTLNNLIPSHTLELFKFALVGLAGTAIQYITLWLGVTFYGEAMATTASSIGFTLGAFVNHHLNRIYTFNTNKSYLITLVQFLFSAVWLFFLNLILMFVLTNYTDLHYLFCQLIATAAVFFTNFLISKFLVFKTIK